MFCNQCEQTAKGTGCTVKGVCGKKPEVAALQDLLVHAVRKLSVYADKGRKNGIIDGTVNRFTVDAMFTTLTNVNFDEERIKDLINQSDKLIVDLKEKLSAKGVEVDADSATKVELASDLKGMISQGEELGLPVNQEVNEDIRSLQMTMLFGIKGVSAYASHAAILGQEDDIVYEYIHEAMAALSDSGKSLDEWVKLVLKCGEINLKAMELLDAGNTGKYGHPVPTKVPLGSKAGKAILVSGHDLNDLEALLKQTEGKGINIYTHGEMLPTHGYPELKKYGHFYGHYGTAWQNQKKEFAAFPGAILMTTNCIQQPAETYSENIFTTGTVGFPGAVHVENDYSKVIERALSLPGFEADEDKGSVMVGFGRNAVMGVADKVVGAVKSGDIKHFFLVAGCDGAKPGRNYYTEFVEKTPKDTVVLTLACGKFRFFDKELGDIGGIPRLLDIGQCNDAYSAIQIAVALSNAFDCDVNELPLSMVLSWYEQKAVAILLSLLHLNIKNIKLGPSLPAFITPNVLNVLVENFAISPIKTPDEDLAEILG